MLMETDITCELTDPLSDNSIATNWNVSTNTIVSVNETENNMSLKIYPTPVKEYSYNRIFGTIKNSGIV